MCSKKEGFSKHKPVIVLSIMVVVLTALIILRVYICDNWLDTTISIVGVAVSMAGIYVTLKQVSSAVDKTEAVREEVMKNNKEIRSFQNYASYNSEINSINSIIDALNTKEYRFIRWQILQLKDFLIKQKADSYIQVNETWTQKMQDLIVDFGADIRNLAAKSSNRDFALDTDDIVNHLTNASDLLSEISGTIEIEKYGTTRD